jgi:DNA-directed RNA polymerase beta' subunit
MEEIKRVKITRYTDGDISKISDCTVNKQFTATTTIFDNTAYDKRMGVFREGELCETCVTNYKDCLGGIGMIDLPVPYLFQENNRHVVFLVNIVCSNCSTILISPKEVFLLSLLMKSTTKYQLIPNYITRMRIICDFCGGKPLNVKEKAGQIIDEEGKHVDLMTLKTILERIDEKDLKKIKVNINYKSLLINKLPVISPYLRIYTMNREAEHNDYGDISLMYNNIIKDILSKKTTDLSSKIEILLTNKSKKKFPNFSNRTVQSVKDMIQGKDGMITNNLSGKRVDFSGRTTITGGPELSIGEFGVPEKMASYITVPIYIPSSDKSTITELYEKHKPLKILKANGTRIRIINKNVLYNSAEGGDFFERPLRNGDIVLVNRQPTLRPESIMAMKIRLVKGINTFRLPIPCTISFNADFDGDEMNMHVTQNYLTWAECQELMFSERMIINSQNGNPIINITQDGKVGLYIITDPKFYIQREDFFDTLLLCNTDLQIDKFNSWNALRNDNLSFKSRQFPGMFLISCFIDESFSFEHIVIRGIIVGNVRWNSKLFNSILHSYCFKVSKSRGCNMIDCIQKSSYTILTRRGFSLSIKDCDILKSFEKPEVIDPESYLSIMDVKVSPLLNKIDNSLISMVKSGAKGSINNVIQISHALGQQSFDGLIIEKEMISDRTLSCFSPGESSIESRGFINNSFVSGLEEYEVLFHAKTGRKGVTDSSITVAESGYLYKRLAKFLEDVMVRYDGSVRTNVRGNIIQFLFGDDGIDIQNLMKEFVDPEALKSIGVTKQNLFVYMLNTSLYLTKKGYHPIYYFLKCRFFEYIYKQCQDESSFKVKPRITRNKIKQFELLLTKLLLAPGTPIGLKASQNVGEVSSQILLKSFHHTGIKEKDISTGVKRLTQLLTSSKKKNQKTIYIISKPNFFEFSLMKDSLGHLNDKCKYFIYSLMETTCVLQMNKNRNIDIIEIINEKTLKIDVTSSLVTLKCSFEFRSISISMIQLVITKIKDIIESTVTYDSYDNYTVFSIKYDCNSDLDAVIKYEQILSINIVKGKLSSIGEAKLNSYGNDFELIFYGEKLSTILSLDFIDKNETYSSDPSENSSVLGIEAGRNSLMKEILKVFTFDGVYIDNRYIKLICDLICRSGKMLGITWSNLDEKEFDPLCSALFERAISRLNALSVKGSIDHCKSLTTSIFLGQLGKMGTGSFDIINKNDEKKNLY